MTLATLTVALAAASGGTANAAPGVAWRVSVTNLTSARAQPLTPPAFVVHSRRADVWSVGRRASRGVWLIAEDGDASALESALAGRRGIRRVVVGDFGIAPGATRRYTVRSSGRFNRLSMVSMLVNTNDGFTGLDSLRLRGDGRTVDAFAYDAGSERNSESDDFVPGPCCGSHFARDPEGRPVRRHPGIAGGRDIDRTRHGWSGPVARISIRRRR